MPIEAGIASKLPLVQAISSWEELFTDPAKRELMDEFSRPTHPYTPPQLQIDELTAPGPHGPVPVRVYQGLPEAGSAEVRPGLVWMHGGAFIGGDLNMPESDWVAHEICVRGNAVVVAVDYRLVKPGIAFPIPHDDVMAAWRWAVASAGELGIDIERLSIGGASAGANLAAGAALHLRDDGDAVQPAALVLAYPCVHATLPAGDDTFEETMSEVPPLFRFPPAAVRQITEMYIGGPAESAPDYAMPGQAALDGLPPTLVITAEYDDLRPSGEDFAAKAQAAGVPVTLVQEPGMLHGHLNREPGVPQVSHSLDLITAALTG